MYLRQTIFVHSRPGGRDRGSTIHGCAGLVKGAPTRVVQCEKSEKSEKSERSRNAVSPAITDGIRTIGSADVTGAKKAKKAKKPPVTAPFRAPYVASQADGLRTPWGGWR